MLCYPDTDWGCASPEWVEGLDPIVKERAEKLAWYTLQALTAYRLSLCPVSVRPCSKGCNSLGEVWYAAPVMWGGGTFQPWINSAGRWVNGCGCGNDDCSCSVVPEVILPGPIGAIASVHVDGALLPSSSYRVDNGNRLVRIDGGLWPVCQDMTAPVDAEGSFIVTYYEGFAPDELTEYAAGVLAVEFAKACTGGKCRLPEGVTSITRQGVSMEIQTGMFPNGYTGIREVDVVIMGLNPHGLRQPSTVASPDSRGPRMTTVRHG